MKDQVTPKKVLCIINENGFLTAGKWYSIISEDNLSYLIDTDFGMELHCKKSLFADEKQLKKEKKRLKLEKLKETLTSK